MNLSIFALSADSENVESGLRHQEEKVTILDALFGCWHKRTGFPITSKPGQRRCEAASQTGTYVVCLDCGSEFPYDWKKMRIVPPSAKQGYAHAGVEVEANG